MDTDTVQIFVRNGASTSDKLDKLDSKYGDDIEVNHKNVEDIKNICRICATVTDLVIPVFAGEGLQNNLADKIHEHLPIKVSEQDVLPLVVCYQCSSTLLAWHELVRCCRQADQALRQSAATNRRHNEKKTNENIILPERKTDKKSPGATRERAFIYRYTERPDDILSRERLKTIRDEEYFKCRDCDDRACGGDSVARMTLPAFDHSKVGEKKSKQVIRNYLNNGSSKVRRVKSTQCDASVPATDEVETEVDRDADFTNGEDMQCEFSDQSNVEDFGPLPESVFEAIEDSREYQEVEHNIDENVTATDDNIKILALNDHREPSPTEGTSESHRYESATRNGVDVKGNKTRKCPKCEKAYSASSSYFYHLKYSHNQTKEYECEVCGKKFGTGASLAAHGSIHTGDRRHACKECGKRFRTAAGRYIHEQTHSGVKAHGCSACGRSFRWRTQLQRHERRHRGERQHACSSCARAFSVRADLLRHARTHAAGAHACRHCGSTFAQPRYLRVHVLNKHPDAPDASPATDDCK